MFGLSGEHLLIIAAVLLIFGPRKLPELGASFGKALRNFKEGLNNPPTSGKLESRDAASITQSTTEQKNNSHNGPSASV